MSKALTAFFLACGLVALRPARADYSDLQVSASGLSGQTVTLSVHNPTSGPVSARVRVVVRVDEQTFYLLTSASFTVAGGATTSVTLSAPEPVAEIEDNPEPFPTVQ
jgi:hypothetical protein